MQTRDMEPSGTQCLDRAIAILLELAEQSPVGQRLCDISRAIDVPRPTVHRILKRLSTSGLVLQERGTHLYKIGPFAHHLDSLDSRKSMLCHVAQQSLERVASETGATTLLFTRNGRFSTCAARVDGIDGDHPAFGRVGVGGLLGPTAGSIAILARLHNSQIEDVLHENEYMIVHLGHTKLDTIWKRINETRRRGVCISRGDFVEGITSVAAPIQAGAQGCFASICVVTARAEVSDTEISRFREILIAEATIIGELLGRENGRLESAAFHRAGRLEQVQ